MALRTQKKATRSSSENPGGNAAGDSLIQLFDVDVGCTVFVNEAIKKEQYTKNDSEFLPRIAVCGKCKMWRVNTSKINNFKNSKKNTDNLRVERASGIAVRNRELTPCSDNKGLHKTVSHDTFG